MEVRLLCCMTRKTWVALQQTPPFDQGLSYTSGLNKELNLVFGELELSWLEQRTENPSWFDSTPSEEVPGKAGC